jgi:hypothetical protein
MIILTEKKNRFNEAGVPNLKNGESIKISYFDIEKHSGGYSVYAPGWSSLGNYCRSWDDVESFMAWHKKKFGVNYRPVSGGNYDLSGRHV